MERTSNRELLIVLAIAAAATLAYPFVPTGVCQAVLYDGLRLLAASVALLGGRRRPADERLAWRLVAFAFFAWFMGDVLWDVAELAWHQETPIGSWPDLAYAAGYVALIGATIALVRRTSTALRFHITDAAIVAVGVAVVCWEPLLIPAGGSVSHAFVLGLYPVVDATVLALVVAVVVGNRPTVAGALLGSGITSLAVADVALLALSRNGSYATGDWPDILFMLGPVAMAAAALAPDVNRMVGQRSNRIQHMTTLALATATLLAFPFGSVGADSDSAGRLVARLLRIAFILLIASRLVWLALSEQRSRAVLEKAEQRFRSLFMDAPIGISLTRPDRQVVDINPGLAAMLGRDHDELLRLGPTLGHPDDDGFVQQLPDLLAGRTRHMRVEKRYSHADGRWIPCQVDIVEHLDDVGETTYILSYLQDITHRKDAERAADEAHLREQHLAELHAVDTERQRIARDLHDGAIQKIFSVGLNLTAFADTTEETHAEQLRSSASALNGVIDDLRRYISELGPAALEAGLLSAIELQVQEFQTASGVVVVLDIDRRTVALLAQSEAHVLQVLNESLSNIRRHANAATCRVTLRLNHADASEVTLTIEDDGCGTPPTETGNGLRNMRARAESLGGSFEVTAVAGEGTTVTMHIPVHA